MTGRHAKSRLLLAAVAALLASAAAVAVSRAIARRDAASQIDTRQVLSVTRNGRTVTFVECPDCEKSMRVAKDGMSATINLCRLRDGNPDAREFARQRAEMIERAFAAMGELSGDSAGAGN